MKLSYSFFLFFVLSSFHMIAQISNYSEKTIKKASRIHKNVITIDTHADFNVNNFVQEKNYSQNLDSQVNIPKMKAGGLDVAWFIVYTGQGNLDTEGYQKASENAMAKFNAIHLLVKEYAPDAIELALTSMDVKRIHASGKKVAMIGVENAYPMGLDLQNIKKFYDLGARYMSLAHNGHSQFSDSNTGEKDDVWLYNGLSELGKKAIIEMNTYGIMVDISHPSRQANMQMIQMSKAPVIASHSSARALCDVSRNLDDELLMMLKENGGVVQTVAFKSYLNQEKLKKIAANKNKENGQKLPQVDMSDFVNHIDYMVQLIGIDHVGISSDFDGGGGISGWKDASETLNVTLELVHRGYSEKEIAKLWGLNLLRVLDEVQEIAKELQKGQ